MTPWLKDFAAAQPLLSWLLARKTNELLLAGSASWLCRLQWLLKLFRELVIDVERQSKGSDERHSGWCDA